MRSTRFVMPFIAAVCLSVAVGCDSKDEAKPKAAPAAKGPASTPKQQLDKAKAGVKDAEKKLEDRNDAMLEAANKQ